jgi:hypothetical protein
MLFRHALEESGDRIVFGSTTGSVWMAENGGDSWLRLISNLPPVYAVTFQKGRTIETRLRVALSAPADGQPHW